MSFKLVSFLTFLSAYKSLQYQIPSLIKPRYSVNRGIRSYTYCTCDVVICVDQVVFDNCSVALSVTPSAAAAAAVIKMIENTCRCHSHNVILCDTVHLQGGPKSKPQSFVHIFVKY